MKKTIIIAIIMAIVTLFPCTVAFACECNCDSCVEPEEVGVSPILIRTTGDVNVRQWADIESPSVAIISADALILADSFYPTNDGRIWAELRNDYGTVQGYISMKYWEYAEETNLPELAQYMVVTGGSVNARSDANINARVLTTVHRDDVIEAEYFVHTSDGRMWAASYLNGEYLGYISCKYLAAC